MPGDKPPVDYYKSDEDKKIAKKVEQGNKNWNAIKGAVGMKESNVNKKFNVSDALYQSVMEVMKKDKKEGSIPRNEREKDLAAHHGDPNRITHGDVLKARGVTKEEAEQQDEGMLDTVKAKVLPILTGGSDKDLLKKLQKDMGVPQTGQKPGTPVKEENETPPTGAYSKQDVLKRAQEKANETPPTGAYSKQDVLKRAQEKANAAKSVEESKDTPGNGYAHQCAVHVKSESFGEGRTITTQHASPDVDGNIEWYDVMFEHGIEKQVPTDTLEILVSEMHMHSKKKKGM
jgi:hypothetical protein